MATPKLSAEEKARKAKKKLKAPLQGKAAKAKKGGAAKKKPQTATEKKVAAAKGDLSKADTEAKERLTSAAIRLVKKEGKLKKERSTWTEKVNKAHSLLVDVIEAEAKTEKQKLKKLDAACVAWQGLTEAEAGKKQALHPLLSDITALKKSLEEQLKNINQLGLPGVG